MRTLGTIKNFILKHLSKKKNQKKKKPMLLLNLETFIATAAFKKNKNASRKI